MHLYLDDDTADRRLGALLTNAGHVVVVPAGVFLAGAQDTRHFIHAMRHSLVLVTRNHDDFLDLHEVVLTANGTHPGILIIRVRPHDPFPPARGKVKMGGNKPGLTPHLNPPPQGGRTMEGSTVADAKL